VVSRDSLNFPTAVFSGRLFLMALFAQRLPIVWIVEPVRMIGSPLDMVELVHFDRFAILQALGT
jgi:hypothetical protein